MSARHNSSMVSKQRSHEQVFLERPDEALRAAVPFRLADKGQPANDAKEVDLGLEVIDSSLLVSMMMAETKAGSDALGEAAMASAERPTRPRPKTSKRYSAAARHGCQRIQPSHDGP